MKSSNNHIHLSTDRPVVRITAGQPKSADEKGAEPPLQENDELPLTDFERNMDRLHQLESETGPPDILSQLEENYKGEREKIYQSGYEAGKKEVREQYSEDVQAVGRIIEQLQESRWRLEREAELNMVELVMQIARRVINSEVQNDPSTIENVLKDALSHIENDEVLEIQLHPDDYDSITKHSTFLDSLSPDTQIKKSASLQRGGCIVQTNMESIDATIDTKLDQISQQLYANLPADGES